MKIVSLDGTEVMVCEKIERQDNNLLMRVVVMGAMPMTVVISPEEGRNALKLLNFKLVLFLISFLFRRSKKQ